MKFHLSNITINKYVILSLVSVQLLIKDPLCEEVINILIAALWLFLPWVCSMESKFLAFIRTWRRKR